MEKKMWKIEQKVTEISKRKRVAAYARVSVESERMQHSLSAQISYYSSLIQKNPAWEYARVYADYGITGTKIIKRKEFQRMLADAEARKIDIILTKSIQRFARNTVDLLKTVRHLKEIGVEVWFEKENIRSLSGDGELMLTILASFAQEESRSISDNIKWRFQKKYEKGIPHAKFFIYGYRWEDGELVIQNEEAAIVRRVFKGYLAGKTRRDIQRELANIGAHTMYGNLFQDSTIKQMLQNPVYKGNLVIQKTFVIDPITKHQVINHGEKDKYVVENHHEAIIDAATFNQVQEEMAWRKEAGKQRGGYARNFLNTSCFTGIIKCGICGKSYIHNIRKYKGKPSEYWSCLSNKGKAEERCGAYGAIPQPALERACMSALEMAIFDKTEFLQRVEKIVVPAYHSLLFYLKDGKVIKQPWKSTALKDMWMEKRKEQVQQRMVQYRKSGLSSRYSAFSERIFCPTCDVKFVRCLETRKNRRVAYWRSRNKHKCVHTSGIQEDWLKKTAAALLGESTFDEQKFREQVEWIEVQKNRTLLFRFYSGENKEVQLS